MVKKVKKIKTCAEIKPLSDTAKTKLATITNDYKLSLGNSMVKERIKACPYLSMCSKESIKKHKDAENRARKYRAKSS